MSKEEQIRIAFEKIQQEADRRIIYTFYIFLPAVFIVGMFYKQPVLALSGCLVSSGLLYFALQYLPHRESKNIGVTVAAITIVIFLQFTAKAMTEAKYSYFILLSILTLYRDRRPIILMFFIGITYLMVGYSIALTDNIFSPIVKTYLIEPNSVSIERFVISMLFALVGCASALILVDTLYTESMTAIKSEIEKEAEFQNYAINVQFADEIAAGNFDAEYASAQADALGKSLLNMRGNLQKASEKDEQDRFISQTTAQISELLRQNTQDVEKLTDLVLAKLIQELEASQGAIYLTEGGQDDTYLEMVACYAYNRKKYLYQHVQVGEGLIGQAYLEKAPIFLTQIPPQYNAINTGLGEVMPSCLLIVPLKTNEKIVGVLEIAALRVFEPHERMFLEKITDNIASTLITARNNRETQYLYQQSQIATEELRTREEEMRQNMEELKTTQEEMQRTQLAMQESQMKSKAIFDGSINSIIIFNEEGWIEEINPSTESMFGYERTYVANMKIENLYAEFADGYQPFIGLRSRLTAKKRNGETFPVQSFLNRFTIGSRNLMLIYSRDASKELVREQETNTKIQQLETAKQQAEEQIQTLQIQLKKALQNAKDNPTH